MRIKGTALFDTTREAITEELGRDRLEAHADVVLPNETVHGAVAPVSHRGACSRGSDAQEGVWPDEKMTEEESGSKEIAGRSVNEKQYRMYEYFPRRNASNTRKPFLLPARRQELWNRIGFGMNVSRGSRAFS